MFKGLFGDVEGEDDERGGGGVGDQGISRDINEEIAQARIDDVNDAREVDTSREAGGLLRTSTRLTLHLLLLLLFLLLLLLLLLLLTRVCMRIYPVGESCSDLSASA